MDMSYIATDKEETHLRCYLMVQGQHYFADIDLNDSTTTLTEASLFEDQSVFKEGTEEDPNLQDQSIVLR